MSKEEFKKYLSQYTKEEIIEAVTKATTFDKKTIELITNILFTNKNKDIETAIDAAFTSWQNAVDDITNFLRKLEAKYGEEPNIFNCTPSEMTKYRDLLVLNKKLINAMML